MRDRIDLVVFLLAAVCVAVLIGYDKKHNDPLVEAGRYFKCADGTRGVLSLKSGIPNDILNDECRESCKLMVAHPAVPVTVGGTTVYSKQAHWEWAGRKARIEARLGGKYNVEEIVAESWPRQTVEQASWEMWHSWSQSPGHWSQANGRCDIYGYYMSYDPVSKTWFAAGLAGRRK